MRKLLRLMLVCGAVVGVSGLGAVAQETTLPNGDATIASPRPLAPGVLRVVAPDRRPEEAVGPSEPLPDLEFEAFQPQFGPVSDTGAVRASSIVFRRDIWGVEFSYLPLRHAEVDVPQPSGKMQRKVVWYLVYRIRFDGQVLQNQERTDAQGRVSYQPTLERVDLSSLDEIRLFPAFSLRAAVVDPITGNVTVKEYLDRVMPTAARQIQQIEDPNQPLLDSVAISTEPLYSRNGEAPSADREIWGVATWEDVDPRTDYVSVQIQGLTNAFDVKQTPAGKQFSYKTLNLNFYRPGDEIDETRDRIRTGVPLVDDVQEQREILTFYELPGPQLAVARYDVQLNVGVPLVKVDTTTDRNFDPAEGAELEAGTIPAPLVAALEPLGYDLSSASATVSIPGNRWLVSASRNGESVDLEVTLAPRFWRKKGSHFEFNDRLDAFWSYR